MRRHLIFSLALCASLAVPAAADLPKPKPIDVKPNVGKLMVFKDDLGNYYVVPTPGQWNDDFDESSKWLFVGDGKSMYQQRIVGFGSQTGSNGPEIEWSLWAPRVKDMQTAQLTSTMSKMTLACSQQRAEDRVLSPLRADEAKLFFAKATFLPPLWTHQSHFLARDDDGTYYFVDQIRDEYGGKGYRVFVGPKGAMKELPMKSIVEDSGGTIYATNGGQLKIIANTGNTANWIKSGKKTELTVLDPGDNRYLIYRELGIYGQLGAVCDEL